jgi:hypothetical protein
MSESLVLWLVVLTPPALWLLAVPFISYRLGRHEVEVLVLGVVVRRVMLGNIDDVLVGARFPAELWPTRWLLSGRFLAIRRKRGLLRYLVITPRHPDRLRANIFFALGWDPSPGGVRSNAAQPPPETGP